MTEYEINQVEQDMKHDKNFYSAIGGMRDPWLYHKLIVILTCASVLAYPMLVSSFELLCPHCSEKIQIHVTDSYHEPETDDCACFDMRLFPDTWTCRGCGYENYEGINYCAMCGGGK